MKHSQSIGQKLAHDLFVRGGTNGEKADRIAFKLGRLGNERTPGGFCEEALAWWVSEWLEANLAITAPLCPEKPDHD